MIYRYKKVRRVLAATLLGAALLTSCAQRQSKSEGGEVIYVTIAPIKFLVEQIVGDHFDVEVLVPAGASPENFEPTPKQYIALNEARAVMSVGLIDFERSLLSALEDPSRLVNLSDSIELIAGSCSHGALHGATDGGEHEATQRGAHRHGVDPHIWTSPIGLQRMTLNCYRAIAEQYPDSLCYRVGYEKLQRDLEELDNWVTGSILASGAERFVIHHPAYTYLARDYGLEQIALESEGKEPSARRIAMVVEQMRTEQLDKIFYQREYPSSVVSIVGADASARCIEVDPMGEDVIGNIKSFITQLTTK